MMDKSQAINYFWKSFGWPAYDENTVPDYIYDDQGNKIKVEPPYITYNVAMDSLENVVSLYASLWDHSNSWKNISMKAKEIEERLGNGGQVIRLDKGALWICKGAPFAQRMSDVDDSIRRIYLNIQVEFLTAY